MSLKYELQQVVMALDSFRTNNKFQREYPEITKAIARMQQNLSAVGFGNDKEEE